MPQYKLIEHCIHGTLLCLQVIIGTQIILAINNKIDHDRRHI